MSKIELKHIVITGPTDDVITRAWNDLLQNCAHATHFLTADFFADPFVGSGDRFAVLVFAGDKMEGVLTGLRNGRHIRCGLPVRPQTAFRNGADRPAVFAQFTKGITDLGGPGLELVDIFSWDRVGDGDHSDFVESQCGGGDRVVMLDLTKGPEILFRGFSERRRTQLRKAMKAGKVSVKPLESEAELAALYQIHRLWNEQKGITSDSFENFSKVLASRFRTVLIALHEDKIIAGTYLRFCENGIVEYSANNSLVEFQHLRPNELLGWRSIEWACENGFTKFSFGASHPFLNRFGGEIVAGYRYRADRSFLRRHSNRERVEALLRGVFASLPASIKRSLQAAIRTSA